MSFLLGEFEIVTTSIKSVPILIGALFYDLSPDKNIKVPGLAQSERDIRLSIKDKKRIALFIDEAHDSFHLTVTELKYPIEIIADGESTLSIIFAVYPKLKNDLRRLITF